MTKSFLVQFTLTIATCMMCVSCNTVNGLGKDFQKVGSGLEKTSQFRLGGSNAAAQDVPSVPGYTEDEYLLPAN